MSGTKLIKRVCAECGREFRCARGTTTKVCSDECRRHRDNRLDRESRRKFRITNPELARARARAKYLKKRDKNPEAFRQKERERNVARRDARSVWGREYRSRNKEKIKERTRAYRAEKGESYRAIQRRWREANREHIREMHRLDKRLQRAEVEILRAMVGDAALKVRAEIQAVRKQVGRP